MTLFPTNLMWFSRVQKFPSPIDNFHFILSRKMYNPQLFQDLSCPICPPALSLNLIHNSLILWPLPSVTLIYSYTCSLRSACRISCTFCTACLVQRIRPSPMLCDMFRWMVSFNGQEVLAPCPTPKLDKHPLCVVREYLFSAATLHSWRPSPPFAEWGPVIP